jgi:hypothetical protein
VATKDHRRYARGLIEALESRVHVGPPIRDTEVASAREYLRQNDFSGASDYFNRLAQIQDRLATRSPRLSLLPTKRNYGGQAGGRWMQLQSTYDHVILSTCYEGGGDGLPGRIKISHRFNQAGRFDFVELKFLRSAHACLNGEIRSLLRVKDYLNIRKEWHATEVFVLPLLPRELVFLYQDIFRCPRHEVLAWLINVGHRMVADLLADLRTRPANGSTHPNGGDGSGQLCLTAIHSDDVALPILEQAASLESAVELNEPRMGVVRYVTTF